MRSKRLAYAISLILATGGLTVAAGLTAAPAYASVTPPAPRFGGSWNHSGTVNGSAVYLQMSPFDEIDDGYICDTSADGYHAHVEIYASATGVAGTQLIIVSKDDTTGANTCVEFYDMDRGNYKLQFEVDTRNGGTNKYHWISPMLTAGFTNADDYTLFARSSGGLTAAEPILGGNVVVCDTESDGHHAYGEEWEYDNEQLNWFLQAYGDETGGTDKCAFVGSVSEYGSQIKLLSETLEGSTLIDERWSKVVNYG